MSKAYQREIRTLIGNQDPAARDIRQFVASIEYTWRSDGLLLFRFSYEREKILRWIRETKRHLSSMIFSKSDQIGLETIPDLVVAYVETSSEADDDFIVNMIEQQVA